MTLQKPREPGTWAAAGALIIAHGMLTKICEDRGLAPGTVRKWADDQDPARPSVQHAAGVDAIMHAEVGITPYYSVYRQRLRMAVCE